MRDMDDITLQPLDDRAKSQIALDRVIAPREIHGAKIRRQRSAFTHLGWRTNQKIFALAVQARASTRTTFRM